MSRVLSVASSNYKIQVANGGTITLDTQAGGAGYGTVFVYGNLDVFGDVNYVATTNTQITDSVIDINYGQSGSAISGTAPFTGQAGLKISRGSSSAALLMFNENLSHYDELTNITLTNVIITGTAGQFSCTASTLILGAAVTITGALGSGSINGYTGGPTTYYIISTNGTTTFTIGAYPYSSTAVTTTASGGAINSTVTVAGKSVTGTFQLKTADGSPSGLSLETITNGVGTTDIVFDLQGTNKVLTVANANTYAANVARANDIPNVAYLRTYVASNYVPGGSQGTAIVTSMQYPLTGAISDANSSIQATSTTIDSKISNVTISSVSSSGVTTGNVIIGGVSTPNQITNTSGNNLILTASNGGMVEVNNYLRLDNQNQTPTYTSFGTEIYSTATPGGGKTGLFFVNSLNYNDELVAKNRSLLFSMLF